VEERIQIGLTKILFMKSRLINTSLVLITIIIAFILSEWALRRMLFSESEAFKSLRVPSAYAIYPKDQSEDYYNDDYWKLLSLFNNRYFIKEPQPLLGWWGRFDKMTLNHVDMNLLKGRRPVLLYGDSFAQCVDTTTCFEEILNNDTVFSRNHFLLNYGVGGYGTDQIRLLFENTYKKYENPFVIFSVLTGDIDRSMLKFRDSNKPYYVLENDELKLKGVPIKLSTEEYLKKNPPAIRSYLLNRFRNSKMNIFRRNQDHWAKGYQENIKDLNRLILGEVFDTLRNSGLDYIILIFNKEDFQIPDWRLDFIINVCEEKGVNFFCDRDLRMKDSKDHIYDPDLYSIAADGHPTSYMNKLISDEIKKYVLESGYSQETAKRNKERWFLNIEFQKKRIQSDQKWMEQIKQKAADKGISIDSMLTLDAIYLLEKHND
jgi:hypothetical protein